ncbi:MAG: hypothetical protein IJS15_13260 [Victivallales bacterium]|nr:hypothetical protein [Victivallales bacterium]
MKPSGALPSTMVLSMSGAHHPRLADKVGDASRLAGLDGVTEAHLLRKRKAILLE